MVIIGNKVDLADQEEVSYSEVKNYANSLGAMYKLTSAKDGKGVNELFTAIAEHI